MTLDHGLKLIIFLVTSVKRIPGCSLLRVDETALGLSTNVFIYTVTTVSIIPSKRPWRTTQ